MSQPSLRPELLSRLESLIDSHSTTSIAASDRRQALVPLENAPAEGTLEFLDEAGNLLGAISDYYQSAISEFEGSDDAASRSTASQLAEIARVAHDQIGETRTNLTVGTKNIWTAAAIVEASLHQALGGLMVVESSIRQVAGLPPKEHSNQSREEALLVRWQYSFLRQTIAGGGTPSDDQLVDRIVQAEQHLEKLRLDQFHVMLRLEDRLELQTLQKRLKSWLVGERELSAGHALWKDLLSFVQVAHQINLREELIELDSDVIEATALELEGWADDDPLPESMIDSLNLLRGRDKGLDKLLQQPRGSFGVGQLKPILSRLKEEIATTKRSLSWVAQTETAHTPAIPDTRPETTPTKMFKNKKQGSWLPVRNRLMDLPAFERAEPGSQPGTPATSSPKRPRVPRVYPDFSKWRYVAAGSLVLILVLALSYARFRGALAEPPDGSADRPIVASTETTDTRVAAPTQGVLPAPLPSPQDTRTEPAAALENVPTAAIEPVRTAAGSAESEDGPRVTATEPVQQSQSSTPVDAKSSDPAAEATESATQASPEETPAAEDPEVATARKLVLPDLWIGDLVEPGEGVVAPQLVEPAELVASAEGEAQEVIARVLVDHLGKVVEVEIPETEGANNADREQLVETARNTRFEPANKDGIPVKMWTELRLQLSGRG